MHPEFIHIGKFAIHTYGVLVAAGFLLGLLLAARRARSAGIAAEQISDLGVWLIITGMGGAKLFHIVFFWHEFIAGWHATGWLSLREGFVFYGGFIGACLVTIVFASRHRLSLWKLADAMAPSVALGHALGRLGCFFNGCCFGKPCTLPWAITFPAGHVMHGIPVHPTQLYEVAGNLALFAGLSLFYRRKRFDGQVWWLYVLLYGVLRFTIEFWRGDYEVYYRGLFTLGHLEAGSMIVVAAVALAWMTQCAGRRVKSEE